MRIATIVRNRLIPPWGHLRAPVTAVYLLTASGYWLNASGSPARENSNSEGNELSALKTEMQKMQKEYEDRISAMEAEMKALESKSDSGSILSTRVLSDADGKGVEEPSQVLDESFLKSLTRNFTFSAYVRAGFQFNGNGGGGTELESWLQERFSDDRGRLMPEWSKGWGYTKSEGAWTNEEFLETVREAVTTADQTSDWDSYVQTMSKYDRYDLFTNSLLKRLAPRSAGVAVDSSSA